MIRLIALDLDGTLLAGGNNLPQENIDALRRAMDAGVKVTIASGRMPEATMPLAELVGANAPLIFFNGAMVYDMQARRTLFSRAIPCAVAKQALSLIEGRGHYVQAFPESGYYYDKHCAWTDVYANKLNLRGTELNQPLSSWLNEDVYKLLSIGTFEEMAELISVLSERFPELAFQKSNANYLEIVAKGVDKAAGLKALCEILNIMPSEILAFGDEMNDLSMLEYAGMGYAMENAASEVKRRISRVAPKNTECGVAKIVNMLLDTGRMGGGA